MYDSNGGGDAVDPLEDMSPDQLRQFLSLGTADDRKQHLQRQLLQAQAMRQGGPQVQHTSPMGALLGGIAGAGTSLAGGLRENQLNKQMGDLLNGQVDARQLFLQKLYGRQAPQQQTLPMGAGDVTPSGEFGLG